MTTDSSLCGLCGRLLGQEDDILSADCGGDCWGCISEVEAEGFGVSTDVYRRDHKLIWDEAVAHFRVGRSPPEDVQ